MNPAIPTRGEELEEFLADGSKIKELFDGEGKPKPEFAEFIKNYADSRMRRDESISQQIEEQVNATLADMLKNQIPAQRGGPGRLDLGLGDSTNVDTAPGSKIDAEKVFDNHGQFLQACWGDRDRLANSVDLNERLERLKSIQNSFGTTIPADGGFLVPETMRQDIMTLALEQGITRPRATIIPMSTPTVTIPAVDDTSHASSLFGGVVMYWTAEAATLTDTQAKFGQVKLEASKLTARSDIPNELITDAPAFLAWFKSRMPRAFAWKEDDGFINGQGAGEPLGWRHAAAMVSVTRETGQSSGGDPGLNTIVWENIIKMYARLLPTSLAGAEWVANIDTFPELATMALSVGTGGSAIWLNQGQDGPPMTILGRPVKFTEKVPTLGAASDINLVDHSYYAIGDLQTMRLEASEHAKFTSDETVLRLIARVDGRPLLLSAITPANGTNTLSAFVNIAQRSS